MEQNYIMDALMLAKRMGSLLNETMDLSRQLAEAVDRNDQVTVQMLVSMRAEPVEKLRQTDKALREQCGGLPPADRQRLTDLLGGAAKGEDKLERALADQAASNARRLEQVLELDKVLNRKLTREKSIYQE